MSNRLADRLRRTLRHLHPGGPLAGLSVSERRLLARIHDRGLTCLTDRKLAALVTTSHAIEARNLEGIFLEAGCALGGSAVLLASVKRRERPLRVYDVFGMTPPPTADGTDDIHAGGRTVVQGRSPGIEGDRRCGDVDDLHDAVRTNLASFDLDCAEHAISLIKGLVQDTLVLDGPVALAHVDLDGYVPVKTCLERVFPRLVVGGSIILDDYLDWGGCRKATDEFLPQVAGQFTLDDSAGSLRVDKTAG